jgi:chromosome segregation ATPase
LSDNIDIRAVTQSVRELISTRIAQMYDDELTNYETKIHQILDFLTTTENHEVYTLDFISRQLSNLHKQIDQLNSEISSLGSRHDAVADRVDRAKSARDIYNTILAAILKRQAALRLEVPGESQTAASTIDVTDENVENYRKGIRKLVQAIFG